MTQHPEVLYGEPEFEGFFLRTADVSSKDESVTVAIKTEGPSVAIIMSRQQARRLAFELIKHVGGTDHQSADLESDPPADLLPPN